jgi:hypothetical protein
MSAKVPIGRAKVRLDTGTQLLAKRRIVLFIGNISRSKTIAESLPTRRRNAMHSRPTQLRFCVPLLCVSFIALTAHAGDPVGGAQQAFEQLKSLQGRWVGEEKMPDGNTRQVEYAYRVQSNGSAVMETAMSGQPEEMTTVFYMAGDKLQATHYCAIGNQPAFRYAPGDDERITMAFAGGTGFDPAKDGHVHEGWIRVVDGDHVEQSWVFYENGAPATSMVLQLERRAD